MQVPWWHCGGVVGDWPTSDVDHIDSKDAAVTDSDAAATVAHDDNTYMAAASSVIAHNGNVT